MLGAMRLPYLWRLCNHDVQYLLWPSVSWDCGLEHYRRHKQHLQQQCCPSSWDYILVNGTAGSKSINGQFEVSSSAMVFDASITTLLSIRPRSVNRNCIWLYLITTSTISGVLLFAMFPASSFQRSLLQVTQCYMTVVVSLLAPRIQ